MSRLKLSLLQFLFVLTIASPAYSTAHSDQDDRKFRYPRAFFGLDEYNIDPDDFSPAPSHVKPQTLNHRFVPDSSGKRQDKKAFKLLFAGQEDPSTVRITVRAPKSSYTLTEKLRYTFFNEKAPEAIVTGTITPHGILTNGHAFLEWVPSVTNRFLAFIGSENFHYRQVKPIAIEQGLTLTYFIADNDDQYYDPRMSIPSSSYSLHTTYKKKDVESVWIDPIYIQDTQKIRRWNYGSLNSTGDLALIKLRDHHKHNPEHVASIIDLLPSGQGNSRVQIYQYPDGHPLQKMAEENADFVSHTHQCVTLGGSSGSSLRDTTSKKIVGVHYAGITGLHNFFIPFDETVAKRINFKLYDMNKPID
jgi:hypothetical protein